MDIGNQIRSLRLRRGVTQEAVAQRLNVTAQAVSKWERVAAEEWQDTAGESVDVIRREILRLEKLL